MGCSNRPTFRGGSTATVAYMSCSIPMYSLYCWAGSQYLFLLLNRRLNVANGLHFLIIFSPTSLSLFLSFHSVFGTFSYFRPPHGIVHKCCYPWKWLISLLQLTQFFNSDDANISRENAGDDRPASGRSVWPPRSSATF